LRRDWDISPGAARLSGGVAHLPQQGDLRYTVPVIYPAREWSSWRIVRHGNPHIERGHTIQSPAMADTTDTANVVIRPPIAWAVAVLAGLALNWLMPLPFVPAAVPAGWLGAMVFALALALLAWAIVTITRAGSNVPTNLPTTTIVEIGPYRFTRNPIYLGMFVGLIGLAIVFDNLWLLMMLVPFAPVIRYGVVAREESYLERKFGDAYRGYRSRVRRWL
jgi:protein-S-isoprenylcysteine O-methyltransferase Ste14